MGWMAMTFGADVRGPQRENPNEFGDPLAFALKRHLEIQPHRTANMAAHFVENRQEIWKNTHYFPSFLIKHYFYYFNHLLIF